MSEPYIALEDLHKHSYRDLQKLAKSLRLPSNVKKIYLIQLIHAKKYQSAQEVENIVQLVKRERQQQSHIRKFSTRKKKQLQAPDITSTCPISSPSIINTPKRPRYTRVQYSPEVCHKRIKYQPQSLLRSAIKKPKHSPDTSKLSDRVLRSCNQNLFKNLSSENSILKVLAENSTSRPASHTITSLIHDQMFPKVNITKCVVKKREASILSSYRKLLANQSTMSFMTNKKDTNKALQTNMPLRHPKVFNSSYPINKEIPNINYEYVQSIGFRRSDGTISKINALVLKNMRNIPKPPNIELTMQELINFNINAQKLNLNSSLPGKNKLRIQYPDMSSTKTTSLITPSKEVTYITQKPKSPPLRTQREEIRYYSNNPSELISSRCLGNLTHLDTPLSNQRENSYSDKPNIQNTRAELTLKTQRDTIVAQKESINLDSRKEITYFSNESVSPSIQRDSTDLGKSLSNQIQPLDEHNKQDTRAYTLLKTQSDFMCSSVQNEFTDNKSSKDFNHSNIPSKSLDSSIQRDTIPYGSMPHNNQKQISNLEKQWEHCDISDKFYYANYLHNKIRNDISISSQGSHEQTLPRINEMFNKFKDLTKPIYIQVDCDRTTNNPMESRNNPNSMSLLENLFNFKNQFLVNQPLLQIATTAKTTCVYSASIVTTAKEQTTNVGVGCMPASCGQASQRCMEMEIPGMNNINVTENQLNMSGAIEMIEIDYACEPSQSCAETEIPDINNANMAERQLNMRGAIVLEDMDYDLINSPESSSQATVPEMVEDALELISQDGDYMERIGMDVRMQCILCSWAGPRFILEHHIRTNHPNQIIKQEHNEWNITYTLGSLVQQQHWLSQVIEYEAVLYILSAKYEDPEYLLVSFTTLSTGPSSKTGTVTIYNKVTGKPYFWSGEIQILPPSLPYYTDSICLKLEISILDLLPNSANLKLINRELVIKSPSKVIVGNPVLNDIHVILFVKIL